MLALCLPALVCFLNLGCPKRGHMASSFPACLHLRLMEADGDGLSSNWLLLLEYHWPTLQVEG